MNKNTIRNSGLLFLAACIWGVAFVSQSVGMDYMGPFTFNGVRCLLGGAALFPLILFRRGKAAYPARLTLKAGICCGLALTGGSVFQQLGLMETTVGKAGFITALYIVIVPVFGIFLGRKAPLKVWAGALAAAGGLYLLCVNEAFSVGRGDLLMLVCAVMFSFHILIIDHFSPKVDGVILSCIQFLVCGLICVAFAFIFEDVSWAGILAGKIPVLYAGILSCGAGYTLQIIGQKDMNPTVAALILSLESVISVLAGWAILGQSLSRREILGCAAVFAAVILVQLPSGRMRPKIRERSADGTE